MARKSDVAKEMVVRTVKKIPTSDAGPGVLCKTKDGKCYQISQNVEKLKFTLWKVVEGGFVKIATASSPINLEELVPWDE